VLIPGRPGNQPTMTEQLLQTGHPIVVGVDGSEHSLSAADLAADEAARRRLPLEIVHAFAPPLPPPPVPPGFAPLVADPEANDALAREQTTLREYAERLLRDAAARVRATHPDLPVVTRLRDGYPAGALTDAAREASLVVVGHRGSGGFAGLLVGSTGVQLAQHAACPVIVARGEPATDAPVVVGVDGSAGAQRAAEFAADAAQSYGTSLLILYAWVGDAGWPPAMAQAGQPPPAVPDVVTQAVTDLTDKFPQLRVHPEVRQHLPAHEALVAASKHARLVVVGSRGHGGFKGLLLGSVSQALIHHAHCPVAIAR
jgi:nucleotide-binding universal stress UspA family protein